MNSAQTAVNSIDGKRYFITSQEATPKVFAHLYARGMQSLRIEGDEIRFNIETTLVVVKVNGGWPLMSAHVELFSGVVLADEDAVRTLDSLRSQAGKETALPADWQESVEDARARLAGKYSHFKTAAFASRDVHGDAWEKPLVKRIIDLATMYRQNHPSFCRD